MKEEYEQPSTGFAVDCDFENTKADLDIKDPEETEAELAIAKHVKSSGYTFTIDREQQEK